MAEITDFKDAATKPGYAKLSQTEVLLTTPHKDGTLLEYFNFSAASPDIRIVLDTGWVKMEIDTVMMEDINDARRVHHLAQAYLALRELGGDPFGTQAQVNGGKKSAPPALTK